MEIFGLKNCDTCRKALKALGPQAQLIDVRAQPLESAFLAKALEQFGAALVNTRSTTWRGLSEAERARPPLDVLQDHPALMKRPLIVAQGKMYLGWTKAVQEQLL
ncbi:MAG: arsenate reductase [Thalassovita sp.]